MAEVSVGATTTPAVHVRRRPYIAVFAALGIVTFIEINLAIIIESLGAEPAFYVPTLIVLATFKASLVAAYYMHLRYEPKWLLLVPFGALGFISVLVFALLGQSS